MAYMNVAKCDLSYLEPWKTRTTGSLLLIQAPLPACKDSVHGILSMFTTREDWKTTLRNHDEPRQVKRCTKQTATSKAPPTRSRPPIKSSRSTHRNRSREERLRLRCTRNVMKNKSKYLVSPYKGGLPWTGSTCRESPMSGAGVQIAT